MLWRRFIAGKTTEDALRVAASFARFKLLTTIDIVGEAVNDPVDADQFANQYHDLLDRLAQSQLPGTDISLKLSMLGLHQPGDLLRRIEPIVVAAGDADRFVRIDMEDSSLTQITLDIAYQLRQQNENLGIVLQAMLFRSEADVEQAISKRMSVRLCKGAYRERPEIAFAHKRDVDLNYLRLAKRLLLADARPAFATHDEAILRAILDWATQQAVTKDGFDFEMLMGIREKRARELVAAGYRVRIYVPYGRDWWPYVRRRLRERKENWLFLLRHLFTP